MSPSSRRYPVELRRRRLKIGKPIVLPDGSSASPSRYGDCSSYSQFESQGGSLQARMCHAMRHLRVTRWNAGASNEKFKGHDASAQRTMGVQRELHQSSRKRRIRSYEDRAALRSAHGSRVRRGTLGSGFPIGASSIRLRRRDARSPRIVASSEISHTELRPRMNADEHG